MKNIHSILKKFKKNIINLYNITLYNKYNFINNIYINI